MKSIELKFGKENIQGVDVFFSTVSILKTAVNNIPREGGLGVEEMSQRLRILDILNKHSEYDVADGKFTEDLLDKKGVLELEDADYQKLKSLFKEVKWNVVARFIVDLSKELDAK